jgi:hypothetical protein
MELVLFLLFAAVIFNLAVRRSPAQARQRRDGVWLP